MITKFLYIVDDHKSRQQTNYKPFMDMAKLDAERTKLIHETIETSIIELISTAACVCIHESMTNGVDKMGNGFDFGKLKQEIISHKIPQVLFSNSANQLTVLELPLHLSIRSDDFYMNLPPFVQAFQEQNVIDLELLALGKNYRREKIVRLKREMMGYFNGYDRDEFVSMSLDERTDLKSVLEKFAVLTEQQTYTDDTFLLLNSGKLTRRIFEQTLTSIIKFIR